MFNIKSSIWLASAVLALTLVAPVAKAAGLAPNKNFVSVRVNNQHVAYGAILSQTKILVPAHVVSGSPTQNYSILAGSTDRTVTSCATCQLRTATSIMRHPNYNTSNYNNDVAIIHVAPLTFNATVFGSTIAAPFSNTVGTQFTQIGFGQGGFNHNRLRTEITAPWTLSTMPGYVYTPGDFLTATTDTTLNGMINYIYPSSQLQVYTKLSDFAAWIAAN